MRRSDVMGVLDATGSGFSISAVTVSDTPTAIPTTNLGNRKAIIIRNWSNTNNVYIGNSSVAATDGFPILPYESIPFDLSSGAQIYGICETGKTAEVRTLEIDNG